MKEKMLKKASMFYVKILKQERLLKYYIDNGWVHHEDIPVIKTRLYCYNYEIEKLRRFLEDA